MSNNKSSPFTGDSDAFAMYGLRGPETRPPANNLFQKIIRPAVVGFDVVTGVLDILLYAKRGWKYRVVTRQPVDYNLDKRNYPKDWAV